jgi:hypothetical protein
VVRSRKGIKLDPSGVLWMELQRGESAPVALRAVLQGLRGDPLPTPPESREKRRA